MSAYILRVARAHLLPRPLKRIFRRIAKYQSINRLSVLELFARAGDWHTIEYSSWIGDLELWEIDPAFESILLHRFPKATIRIGDTYELILSDFTKFDVIISDNPISKHGNHWEHFDLFPSIFQRLADNAFLILDVIPVINDDARLAVPQGFDIDHMEARKAFYDCDHPERISIEAIIARYCSLFDEAGWIVVETALERRNEVVKYLLLVLHKKGTAV